MTSKNARLLLPLLAGSLLLGACSSDSGGTGASSGKVSVRLVDAPGDLKEARVQIQQIYLQGASESDSTAGRLQLGGSSDTYYDLLTLGSGSFADLVKDAVVPAGTYSSLRIVIGDAYVVTRDGKVYATPGATLPAGVTATGNLLRTRGKSSGYQVQFTGGGLTVSGDTKLVVLDFDVANSFGHVAGNSGSYVLNPHFTVTQASLTGSISGTVSANRVTFPACGGGATDLSQFTATASSGATLLAARAGTDGKFAFPYAAAGTYTMGMAPVAYANGDSLSFTATANPTSVTVASGASTTVSYTVTAAACKPHA
jgi:Domain of unknown function (DUF4382)